MRTRVRRNLFYLICLRLLISSRAVTNRIFLSKKTYYPSCVRNMLWVTITYKYHGSHPFWIVTYMKWVTSSWTDSMSVCLWVRIHLTLLTSARQLCTGILIKNNTSKCCMSKCFTSNVGLTYLGRFSCILAFFS